MLVADEHAPNTAKARSLPVGTSDIRERPTIERAARVPLERLDVIELTALHEGGGGVRDVSFSIARGEFVVVTGPVGSGKSTLLRALVGLLPHAELGRRGALERRGRSRTGRRSSCRRTRRSSRRCRS